MSTSRSRTTPRMAPKKATKSPTAGKAGGLGGGLGGGLSLGIGVGMGGGMTVKGMSKATPSPKASSSAKKMTDSKSSPSSSATGAAAKKKTTTKTSTTSTTARKTATSTLKRGTASKVGSTRKTGVKGKLKTTKSKKKSEEELALEKKRTEAALVIQSSFRGYKSKKEQELARQKKLEMEKQMEELRKQAWLAEIERQRKLDAERRKKQMEEAKRRKEEVGMRKKLLEAAYDGEIEDLEKLWPRAVEIFKGNFAAVETSDGHDTTLLSEAAAGGCVPCVAWLLEKGAFPNSVGEFKRTPIWRSCFLGHAEVVKQLLEAGGDPRIASESGEVASNVASTDEIKAILEEWDVSQTDKLVSDWERKQEERVEAEKKAKEDMLMGLANDVESAQQENDQMQKLLKHAHQELEKRITEYDTCVQEAKPQSLLDAALTAIKEAEHTLKECKAKAEVAREALQMTKLSLREQEQENADGAEGEEEAAGIYVEMKDLDDVLIKDVGDKVKESGKAACVIDISKQASVFLRYLDTNYVNALSRANMESNMLRRSIVGAIRYGKPLVFDLMDVDVWESIQLDFDMIKKDLLKMLLDRSILKDEAYLSLVKESDGEEYHPTKFQDDRIEKFKFIILTSERFPAKDVLDQTYIIRVLVKGS